jgi:hypothetical protein
MSASFEARSAPLPYPTVDIDRPNCLIINCLRWNLGASRIWPVYFILTLAAGRRRDLETERTCKETHKCDSRSLQII